MMANRLTGYLCLGSGKNSCFFWEIRRMKKRHQDLTPLNMDQKHPMPMARNAWMGYDGMESVKKTFQHTL